MTETSSDPPDIRNHSPGLNQKAYGLFRRDKASDLHGTDGLAHSVSDPSNSQQQKDTTLRQPGGLTSDQTDVHNLSYDEKLASSNLNTASNGHTAKTVASKQKEQGDIITPGGLDDDASSSNSDPNIDGSNNNDANGDSQQSKAKSIWLETRKTCWAVLTYSWINVLLIFVPVGIAVAQIDSLNGGVVFALNAIAIIPLAGLLSHATESVARKMGDALGALLNVTFGNAVELIIFIIALVKDEIRIVQASLLGSILANLLLILGMGFFLGGLRFQEQLYNSTVTQMSACLLSLSVISLVLPTAFHASFSDPHKADSESLKVSRGTSVILLLVYGIYLLFQLKSHAYLYESTPQHIVDAESTPGPAAAWLDSSSSDDSSSSSSDSDSSHDTVRRKMKKVLRTGRRRKSSVASLDTTDTNFLRSSSFGTNKESPQEEAVSEASSSRPGPPPLFPRMNSADGAEEAVEDRPSRRRQKGRAKRRKNEKHKKQQRKQHGSDGGGGGGGDVGPIISERPEQARDADLEGEPRRVDFAVPNDEAADEPGTLGATQSNGAPKRPFPALRGMSVRNVKNLAPAVFVSPPEPGSQGLATRATNVPRVRYGIRRTNSLPDRLNMHQQQYRAPGAMLSARSAARAVHDDALAVPSAAKQEEEGDVWHLSQTAAILLLLVSTGLVAVCAEFLVDSIQDVTSTSSVGEMFIGLIILPIVGNAAEHVTALTVAMKNKMDLAIGVAVGSSIQIAIFVTPLVVILGWIMDKDMSLYFTLFETVCLFVSAFMVNFLVLDGRSNYLEGALLCAVYIIIAIVAFFYPKPDDASQWGQ